MRVLQKAHRKISSVGIDDHELTGINVVTAAALLDTQKGPIIGIFHQYTHLGKVTEICTRRRGERFRLLVNALDG